MSILAAPASHVATTPQLRPPRPGLGRPDPALVVLAFADPAEIARAGHLLRPAPALALVRVPPAVWPVLPPGAGTAVMLRHQARFEGGRQRALALAVEAAVRAGFDVQAGETIVADGLAARLRDLGGRGALVVASADRPARLRALALAARGAVLALPHGAHAMSGPAVMGADCARRCIATVARSLATDRVVLVGPASPGAEAARALGERIGLTVERTGGRGAGAARAVARELDGVMVDAGGDWRRSLATRRALREGRPVLLVPGLPPLGTVAGPA